MIGKIKVAVDRQRGYLGLFQFVMVGYLFFERVGWRWEYAIIIPFWVAFTYIDARYILPKEIEYVHRKSSVLQELLNK